MKQIDNVFGKKGLNMGYEIDLCGTLFYDSIKHLKNIKDFRNISEKNSETFRFFYDLSIAIERMFKVIIFLNQGHLKKPSNGKKEDYTHFIKILKDRAGVIFKNKNINLFFSWFDKYYGKRYEIYEYNEYNGATFFNDLLKLIDYMEGNDDKKIFNEFKNGENIDKSLFDNFKKIEIVVLNTSIELADVIRKLSSQQGLFLNEFMHGKKSQFVFNKCYLEAEKNEFTGDHIKKELIIFLINKGFSEKFKEWAKEFPDEDVLKDWPLPNILELVTPLKLDVALAKDYIDALINDDISDVYGEVEAGLVEDFKSDEIKKRIEILKNF